MLPDTDNVSKTLLPDSHLDPAVIVILAADSNTATIEPYGQAGFSTLSKISIVKDGKISVYFMKTGPGGEMFRGESFRITIDC